MVTSAHVARAHLQSSRLSGGSGQSSVHVSRQMLPIYEGRSKAKAAETCTSPRHQYFQLASALVISLCVCILFLDISRLCLEFVRT